LPTTSPSGIDRRAVGLLAAPIQRFFDALQTFAGRPNPTLDSRYSAEHIRGARFIGYPNGGHLLVGHLKEALSETAAFLK